MTSSSASLQFCRHHVYAIAPCSQLGCHSPLQKSARRLDRIQHFERKTIRSRSQIIQDKVPLEPLNGIEQSITPAVNPLYRQSQFIQSAQCV